MTHKLIKEFHTLVISFLYILHAALLKTSFIQHVLLANDLRIHGVDFSRGAIILIAVPLSAIHIFQMCLNEPREQ